MKIRCFTHNTFQMTSQTRCWLAVLFVCCSEFVVVVDFDFFSAILLSWIIIEIPNAPHKRLEINGGLWTRQSWTVPINSPHTSWTQPLLAKYLRVTKPCDSGVNLRNRYDCWSQRPSQCWRLRSRCLLVWFWIFEKNIHYRNVSIKRMGSVPKKSVHSQHSRRLETYKTEQPFFPGV